jgi:hypothetical protein
LPLSIFLVDLTFFPKKDESSSNVIRLFALVLADCVVKGGPGPAPVPQFEQVAKAFTAHYYNIFDTNRAMLVSMYADTSLLTFENFKVGVIGCLLFLFC